MLNGFFAKFILCPLLVTAFLTSTASAQLASSTGLGPRRQLATIIFSGLGGAILGLSTLSFYGRPQEKLENIMVGFAVGVISGTVYTTYKVAIEPYSRPYALSPEVWPSLDPVSLSQGHLSASEDLRKRPSFQLQWQWHF